MRKYQKFSLRSERKLPQVKSLNNRQFYGLQQILSRLMGALLLGNPPTAKAQNKTRLPAFTLNTSLSPFGLTDIGGYTSSRFEDLDGDGFTATGNRNSGTITRAFTSNTGFNSGKFTFALDKSEYLENQEIFLHDVLTDELIEITKESYSVELEEGNHSDRFTLRFIGEKVTGITDDLAETGISIPSHSKQIQINFSDAESANSNIAVYNL